MYVDPMLCDEADEPFESEDHIAELKIDGIRGIISSHDRVRMYTRHRNEMTSRFPEITAAASAALGKGTIVDGELAVCDTATGKPDFEAMMARFHSTRRMKETPGLCFVAFDILAYKGEDVTGLPLMTRKAMLEEAVKENELIKRIRYFESGFVPLFEQCKAQELEGIMIKRRNGRYIKNSRPEGLFIRVVNYQRDENVIVTGFSKKTVAWSIGVLRGGKIVPAGLLEYGLNSDLGKAVFPILRKAVIRETNDFAYVEPFVRIGVRFRNWTKAGKMRLAVLERVIV